MLQKQNFLNMSKINGFGERNVFLKSIDIIETVTTQF